jgi:hypothetical protein
MAVPSQEREKTRVYNPWRKGSSPHILASGCGGHRPNFKTGRFVKENRHQYHILGMFHNPQSMIVKNGDNPRMRYCLKGPDRPAWESGRVRLLGRNLLENTAWEK